MPRPSSFPANRPLRPAALALAGAAFAALAAAGCNATLTIKPQTKYVAASPVTKASTRAVVAGDAIEIENANGDVVVTGDPTATMVKISTKVVAFADDQADGDAAIADVTSTISIDESTGKLYIHCSEAKAAHGSASSGTSACEGFTVTVPAGSAAMPINVKATAHNGQIDATGLSGGAIIHSDNGDASAAVTPGVGATLEVSSGNGSATLAVPASFTADTVTLTAGGSGKVISSDFPDVLQAATSANRKAGGAKSITVKTDLGDVTLKKQ